jgi:ABC-type transport system involved in multi-copper enzyme maturation permease subunit
LVSCFPVIERELRVQARRSATYWSRFGWGIAVCAWLFALASLVPHVVQNGRNMLTYLHGALFVILALTAPIAAADSLSREKREGTLGLLFLTPLRIWDVILGKYAVHGFRLTYMWLLLLPLMALPLLLGGVGPVDFLVSAGILLSILLIGLSAAMVASALCVGAAAATIAALALAFFLSLALAALVSNALYVSFGESSRLGDPPLWVYLLGPSLMLLLAPMAEVRAICAMLGLPPLLDWTVLTLFLFALWLTSCSVRFCVWRLRAQAGAVGETARQIRFRRRFLTPVIGRRMLRRWQQRVLDRNPLAWLEYRTAWSRAGRWAALLLLLAVETGLLVLYPVWGYSAIPASSQYCLLNAVLILMTLKSASSFWLEREQNAFELLLVAPIRESRLVLGRLLAVYGYFAPLLVTLLLFDGILWWLGESVFQRGDPPAVISYGTAWASIASVPATGLFFALRSKSLLAALAWTVSLAIVLPAILMPALQSMSWYAAKKWGWDIAYTLQDIASGATLPGLMLVAFYHVVLIYSCLWATRIGLELRSFARLG